MSIIHWIHFSDLHINKHGHQTDTMRDRLPKYISNIAKKAPIDYLFFTGDIRFAPEKKFPLEISEYFNNLLNAAEIEKDKLFLVIGNHDVDRNNPKRMSAVEEVMSTYFDSDSVIKNRQIEKLKSGRQNLYKSLETFLDPNQYEYHTDKKRLHFLVETDDINILHIDSTITYAEDRPNDLVIGAYAFRETVKKCNPEKPTIVLSHYSLSSFEPNEAKAVLRTMKDNGIQIWLSGHKHTDIIHKYGDYFYVAHSGNQNYEKDTEPGFVEGFLDTETGTGSFIVHKWNKSSDWAVYQTLIDSTDLKSRDYDLDKTKYTFVLDKWLGLNGRSPKTINAMDLKLKDFLSNYNGQSFLTETLCEEMNCSKENLIKILEQLKKDGFIKPTNRNKTQWEILKK